MMTEGSELDKKIAARKGSMLLSADTSINASPEQSTWLSSYNVQKYKKEGFAKMKRDNDELASKEKKEQKKQKKEKKVTGKGNKKK